MNIMQNSSLKRRIGLNLISAKKLDMNVLLLGVSSMV